MDKTKNKLNRIVLMEALKTTEPIFKSLHMKDKQLEDFQKKIDFQVSNLKDLEEMGIFDTPKKFRISNLNKENPY